MTGLIDNVERFRAVLRPPWGARWWIKAQVKAEGRGKAGGVKLATDPEAARDQGKTMGHAGAIVSGSAGTAHAKKEALESAGVLVGTTPSATALQAWEVASAMTTHLLA